MTTTDADNTGTPNTGTPKTGTPNTGTPKTGTPDIGTPKTGTPDIGTPNIAAVGADPGARVPLVVATGLLMTTTITWRGGAYYSGGLDPVVAAKAVLGLAAAAIALHAVQVVGVRRRVDQWTAVFLLSTGVLSAFGAWATGALLFASTVLFVRLALLASTVYLLVRAYDPLRLLRVFCAWLAVAAAVASLTGSTAGSLRTGAGRLIGGIPPLQPNEIAQLCALTVIVTLWAYLNGRTRRGELVVVVALLTALWLTQSRTTLTFLGVALVVLVSFTRRLKLGFVLSCLALIPVAVFVGFGTQAATHLADRGGSASITSLSQRTVAWSAALHVHTGFWQVWFGNGLARTSIPVVAQYRTQQILDSTWVSALVQTGVLGLALLAVWVIRTMVRAFRVGPGAREVFAPLIVFTVGLSFLESGMIGATPEFVVFLIVSLTAGVAPAGATARATVLPSLRTATGPRPPVS